MTEAGDAKPSGVPIAELDIEQISALQRQVEQELGFFQESANQLKALIRKNDQSIASMEVLKTATPGHTALIPLSESMYIRAELNDPSRMLVEMGTGYFAEISREKAAEFFERKKRYITQQVETIEKIIGDKKRTRNIISETLQSKIQAQLAQMPLPKQHFLLTYPSALLRDISSSRFKFMRNDPLSTCERKFILEGFAENQRLDGRTLNDFRQVKLVVGAECGTALCTMGDTKVLCAVSASLTEPRATRPNKGFVAVDVDMSPMGNPANEHNRLGERGLELTRLLELVLRDSRCIDVESLCVRAHKEVWKLRVDVRVLDDDGALLDCASVAAVAALYHFRRPNVTVEPNHTIIHSEYEQALVPLNIYHMPICVSFGFTKAGNYVVIDPTDKETQCLYGCLVIACNKRREVCALHQSTNLILSTSTIEACVKRAMQRAVDLTELVSTVIRDDATKRAKYQKPAGFELTVNAQLLTTKEAQLSCCDNPYGVIIVEISLPNELVAPAVELTEELLQTEQPSVMLNENPLTRDNGSEFDERTEEKALAGQVASIVDGVDSVSMDTTTQSEPSTSQRKGAISNRKRELDEVADLLEDLDDLEGETVELNLVQPRPKQEASSMDIDLLKARKKT
ncbi:prefoldin, alpha subunit [Ancylostoma duodenale]|uniref:Exosome complex component RRP45 n=1 Tax=Ancylostoma duodenale TaxID=51022 RepID=A0A0C2GQH6_9BILA|nr:prefoldin, alpha subunit [Ancylostoma duodenale]